MPEATPRGQARPTLPPGLDSPISPPVSRFRSVAVLVAVVACVGGACHHVPPPALPALPESPDAAVSYREQVQPMIGSPYDERLYKILD